MSLSRSRVHSSIFPVTASISAAGHLVLGGCDTVELAAEYGTPLYVFDEETLRAQCAAFRDGFRAVYPETKVLYACKAFINRSLLRLFAEEGLGLDVVSGGELSIALSADFPPEAIYFHGNNKTRQELELALKAGVGRIVIDHLGEIAQVEEMAAALGRRQPVLLRITPGIDPHTHRHTTTGHVDSKFGLPLGDGIAEEGVRRALAASHLELLGFHCHLGSPIYETEPYVEGIETMVQFAAEMQRKHGFEWQEFSPGGGFAIQYVLDRPAPEPRIYAQAIGETLRQACARLGLREPTLVIEPGRAIVGRAGVALYTVGAIKEVPGVRTYVAVDGGMGDNIRPALYEARYEAVCAQRAEAEDTELVTICGKYCESGDVLIRDIWLPPLQPGDIIAIPAAGAYCLAMASQYNANPRPAVVLVRDGRARLIRRRESYEDLAFWDVE